ncbi:Lcl C-terminal domain-containing protein [Planctobacterium marinum]|uniref:Lcl C-terminal domain-containing protein n=1 Tax=Planctobacterium marinum TaxID=1631968 RepID=UPI001E617508|nr:DUF1566 domain-containing protein [Planctobacterium marinum]MCC2604506.1 DUF1566 domain-containing protein [Planctobacterium marinum]
MDLRHWLLVSLTTSLLACGGDSSDEDVDSVTILVSAGSTVNEQSEVTLSGRTTLDNVSSYSWSVSDSDYTLEHEDSASVAATLTTPEVRTSSEQVTLTLSATSEEGGTISGTFTLTVEPVNIAPTADVAISQDNRFDENTYGGAIAVTFTGSGADEDPIDAESPISAYSWQQVSGTDVLTGLDVSGSSLTITTPALAASETLGFEFTVTDNEGGTFTEPFEIVVLDVTQTHPIAEAGEAITIMEGERFLLAGSATSLSDDATPFLFEWTNNSSDLAEFADASDATTYADAPAVTEDTDITIDLRVVDQFNNEDNDQVVVTVREMPATYVNDTGVVVNVSNTGLINGSSHSFPGQDADIGRDRMHESDVLEKAGAGDEGFDFTKLDEFGDEIDATETDWSCVRDNVTGLIWELKTNDAGLHDVDNTYSWVSSTTSEENQNDSASCTIANCNTAAFVEAVNAEGLCGFYDWRIPTHNELMSIMHFGESGGTFVDRDYFPFNSPDTSVPTWYWTNVQNVDGASGDTLQNSWAIDFSSGNDNFLLKSSENYLRLVRAGR